MWKNKQQSNSGSSSEYRHIKLLIPREKSPSVRVSTGKSTEMGTSFHTYQAEKERKKNKGNLYREDLKRAEVRCPGTKEREESF